MSEDLLGGGFGEMNGGSSSENGVVSKDAPPTSNGDSTTPSFDLLSGSPIKQKPVIDSLESGTSSSDSSLAFAKPPPPGTELPVVNIEESDVVAEETAATDSPDLQHQQSVNLLDFGGSSDDGTNLMDAPPVQPSSSQEEPQPDLFEAANTTEGNLLDHRDSFAPQAAAESGETLVDLFGAAPVAPGTATQPATNDLFDAFAAAPAPQPTVPASDPFGDFAAAPATPAEPESDAPTPKAETEYAPEKESVTEIAMNGVNVEAPAPEASSISKEADQSQAPNADEAPSSMNVDDQSREPELATTNEANDSPTADETATQEAKETAQELQDTPQTAAQETMVEQPDNSSDAPVEAAIANDDDPGPGDTAAKTEPTMPTTKESKEEVAEDEVVPLPETENAQADEKAETAASKSPEATSEEASSSADPSTATAATTQMAERSATASDDAQDSAEQAPESTTAVAPTQQHETVQEPQRFEKDGIIEEDKKEDDLDAQEEFTDIPIDDKQDADTQEEFTEIPIDGSADTPKMAISTPEAVPSTPSPKTADKDALQQHIQMLEKQLNAAHDTITKLQNHDNSEKEKAKDDAIVELQANLQKEMNRRAEIENDLRLSQTKCQKVNEEYALFKTNAEESIATLTNDVEAIKSEKDALLKEVEDIREERDEQARKQMALTTRLNAAKKQEAVKANSAEYYEDQVEELKKQASDYKSGLETMTAERDQLQQELGEWKTYAEKRTKQLETALNDEKKLNDERKRKMKGFVEAKTEEVRAAKADYVSLQTELDETSHSLKELNQRYKQLHAQWVQSQTRNRELQRDMTKMKKDSEKMVKTGGTLEARLSRSAQESEDHKNKRIQAKHELMSVLSQLETERAVNNRLQESIRMTFTPKALSQQQTIQEALDDFEGALHKLSTRLGRPLPPPPMDSNSELLADPMGDNGSEDGSILGTNVDISDDDDVKSGISSTTNLSEINTNKVLQKLESETQRVSRNIVSFSSSVERMHALLEGAGPRNCVDVFSAMLMGGGSGPSEETRAITGNRPSSARGGSRYGQVSGTMT